MSFPTPSPTRRVLRHPVLFFIAVALVLGGCRDQSTDPGLRPSDAARAVGGFTGIAAGSLVFPAAPNTAVLQTDGSIRLTRDSIPNQNGAVWHATKQTLAGGFTSTFTFSMKDTNGNPADGLTFVIQSESASPLKVPAPSTSCGSCLAYSGLTRALVVEFDVFPDANFGPRHVEIRSNGANAVTHDNPDHQLDVADFELKSDGTRHTAKVVYSPPTPTGGANLHVYVDNLSTPLLSVAYDLAANGVLASGQAWVGFTAATGGSDQEHTIHAWSLETQGVNQPPSITSITVPTAAAPGLIPFSATATDPDGDALTYSWTVTPVAGPAAAGAPTPATLAGASPSFTTGAPGGLGRYNVALTVSDGQGGTASSPTNALLVGHEVPVTVSSPGPVSGSVVVTAVRAVASAAAGGGEFRVELALLDTLTGSNRYVFYLTDGSWIFHARNIADRGTAVNGFFLPVAPLPDGNAALATGGVANLNRTGVLYHPTAPGTSVPLTPANYLQRVQSPVVLSGGASVLPINLTFGTGGTVQCALKDENGNPASVTGIENVFTVFPFQAGDVLPPLPAGAPGANLQRGLLLGVGTLSSTGGCQISGVPSTTGFSQPPVLETNVVNIGTAANPKQVIYVESFQSTGAGTTTVNLVAQPARSFVDYISDPYGDGTAQGDIGLVSYGWTAGATGPTNFFAVGATHHGTGTFTLEVIYEGPWIGPHDLEQDRNPPQIRRRTINARAVWDAGDRRFRMLDVTGIARNRVTVSGFAEAQATGQVGTVNWLVDLPGVTRVELRVLAGAPNAVDFAPNSGYRVALKSATGHSWNVMD